MYHHLTLLPCCLLNHVSHLHEWCPLYHLSRIQPNPSLCWVTQYSLYYFFLFFRSSNSGGMVVTKLGRSYLLNTRVCAHGKGLQEWVDLQYPCEWSAPASLRKHPFAIQSPSLDIYISMSYRWKDYTWRDGEIWSYLHKMPPWICSTQKSFLHNGYSHHWWADTRELQRSLHPTCWLIWWWW